MSPPNLPTAGAGGRPGVASGAVRRGAFLVSRLLNHSRFPAGRAHGFAAPLRVALGLRPKCPQGTRFPSRLWTLETLARCGSGGGPHPWRERWARGRAYRGGSGRMQRGFCRLGQGAWPGVGRYGVRRGAFLAPGCSIIRASLTVALMVSLPSQISAFCALTARSPCICSRLRVALRFAQQPTGLTLPSGALRVALGLRPKCPQGTRFPSRLSGARNACAACVRRKDGPCHSERRAGMGPARKRAATKPIPRTARAAAHGGRTCEPTFFRETVDKAKRWCYHSSHQRRRRQSRYESSAHGLQLRLFLYLWLYVYA